MSEQQTIEFKQSSHDEYLKWIGGFANAQGGINFIGEDYDRINYDIKNRMGKLLGRGKIIKQNQQWHQ